MKRKMYSPSYRCGQFFFLLTSWGSPRGRLWADVFIPQSGRPGAVHECLKVVTATRSARLGQSPCAPFCFWPEFATRLSPYWSLSGFRGLLGIGSRFSTATALVVTTRFSLPDCVRGKCHFDDDRFWVSVAVTFKRNWKFCDSWTITEWNCQLQVLE